MRRDVVETLIDTQTRENLVAAKDALVRGQVLPFSVGGTDEGEKLTNLLAALHVLDCMKRGTEFDMALRHYHTQVREII